MLVIPFTHEVRVKAIVLMPCADGQAPSTMKLYKNEENVDIDIVEDKKPIQKIDLVDGNECEYPCNMTKTSGVSNLVLGFEGSFGADKNGLRFIGLKGDLLRAKTRPGEIVYELIGSGKEYKLEEETSNLMNIGA